MSIIKNLNQKFYKLTKFENNQVIKKYKPDVLVICKYIDYSFTIGLQTDVVDKYNLVVMIRYCYQCYI